MWHPPQRIRHPLPSSHWPSIQEAEASRLFSPLKAGRLALPTEHGCRRWFPGVRLRKALSPATSWRGMSALHEASESISRSSSSGIPNSQPRSPRGEKRTVSDAALPKLPKFQKLPKFKNAKIRELRRSFNRMGRDVPGTGIQSIAPPVSAGHDFGNSGNFANW
jgi:hypothetical protein